MIPGIELVEFIKLVGVAGVALVIFAESGLLIGFFLPGDSLLFTAGFLTYTGFLPVNINVLVAILFAAAVIGDSVGYTFGRRVGYKLFNRPDSLLFKQENITKAEVFYKKHGPKTIVIARFIPFIRTFAPVIAGIAKMDYKQFLAYNLLGGFLWAVGITYLGYFLGAWFESMGIDIDTVLLPIIALIIFASVAPPLFHIFKDKDQRTAIVKGTKHHVKKTFKKK